MGAMDQNVLKIWMIYRKIFSLTGNGKYTCNGNHILCTTVPNAKDLKELGTNKLHIIREKRKISIQCFLIKFEVGKKKNYFYNDTILATAFP